MEELATIARFPVEEKGRGEGWACTAGDPERFALTLALDEPAADAVTDEWDLACRGRLRLVVGGQSLCAHRRADEVVDFVEGDMLPLLEWLAAAWEPLLHEEKLPTRTAGDVAWNSLRRTARAGGAGEAAAWRSRHALRASGLPLPDVIIRRWRDLVEVSWGSLAEAGADRFELRSGRWAERLPPDEVAEPLFTVLEAAAQHLALHHPASLRVVRLLRRVAAIPDEPPSARLGWQAGMGRTPEEMQRRWDAATRAAAGGLPGAGEGPVDGEIVLRGGSLASLLLGSVAPDLGDDEVAALLGRVAAHLGAGRGPEIPPFHPSVRAVSVGRRGEAWEHGYQLAAELLADLSIDVDRDGPIAVDSIVRRLGVVVDDADLGRGIRAVSLAAPGRRPQIVVNRAMRQNHGREGRRFTVAHELCHVLHDRSEQGLLALASGRWAPPEMERRANAFAAMILMPTAKVMRLLGRQPWAADTVEGIGALARALGTSRLATLEHLSNILAWDSGTHDRLRASLDDAPVSAA